MIIDLDINIYYLLVAFHFYDFMLCYIFLEPGSEKYSPDGYALCELILNTSVYQNFFNLSRKVSYLGQFY